MSLDYGKTFDLIELASLFEVFRLKSVGLTSPDTHPCQDTNLVQFLEARLATLKEKKNCKHYWVLSSIIMNVEVAESFHFQRGPCPWGAKCRFLHVERADNYRTRMCQGGVECRVNLLLSQNKHQQSYEVSSTD